MNNNYTHCNIDEMEVKPKMKINLDNFFSLNHTKQQKHGP